MVIVTDREKKKETSRIEKKVAFEAVVWEILKAKKKKERMAYINNAIVQQYATDHRNIMRSYSLSDEQIQENISNIDYVSDEEQKEIEEILENMSDEDREVVYMWTYTI